MIIGEFLRWFEHATVEERRQAATVLTRSSLKPDLTLEERGSCEAALSVLLDDPSPLVRRAVADQLSLSRNAPQHLLDTLALEAVSVSAPILRRSPLSDGLLKERISDGCSKAQTLIADRSRVSEFVALSLSRHGCLEAALVLLTNTGATLTEQAIDLLIERFGDVSEMRGVLLSDDRLTLMQRQLLIDQAANAISRSGLVTGVLGEKRAERVAAKAVENAPILLAMQAEDGEIGAFATMLREQNRINSGIILRALVYGRISFLAAILSDLSGRSEAGVHGMMVNGSRSALSALLAECGLAGLVQRLCAEGILIWRDIASGRRTMGIQELCYTLLQSAEKGGRDAQNDDLVGLLRSLYADIARDNARDHAAQLIEREIERIETEHLVEKTCLSVLEGGAFLDDEILTLIDESEAGLEPEIDLDGLIDQDELFADEILAAITEDLDLSPVAEDRVAA